MINRVGCASYFLQNISIYENKINAILICMSHKCSYLLNYLELSKVANTVCNKLLRNTIAYTIKVEKQSFTLLIIWGYDLLQINLVYHIAYLYGILLGFEFLAV